VSNEASPTVIASLFKYPAFLCQRLHLSCFVRDILDLRQSPRYFSPVALLQNSIVAYDRVGWQQHVAAGFALHVSGLI